MALFKYFKRMPTETPSLPTKLDSLSEAQLQKVNEHIRKTVGDKAMHKLQNRDQAKRHQYNDYSAKEGADIGPKILRNAITTNTAIEHVRFHAQRQHAYVKLENVCAYKIYVIYEIANI